MFPSLRTKLVAAFVLIIILTLALAAATSVYLLRRYQTQVRLDELAEVELPLAGQVRLLQREGNTVPQITTFLDDQASALGVRILLASQQRIIADSGNELVGQTIQANSVGGDPQTSPFASTASVVSNPNLVIVGPPARPRRLPGDQRPADPRVTDPSYDVYIAVPQESLGAAWLQLAPSLSIATLLSLLASIIVGIMLARSIARPLARVTSASERMARGDFDQSIPESGRDEVAQLARTFNTMAREVGQMHRTMRDLLANVSHELRTPLTSIQGFAQAISDGSLKTKEEYGQAGEIIKEEAERMYRLVDDLLYLSKIESGQITMEKRKVELTELLAECARPFQHRAEVNNQELKLDVKPVPPILADGHRLEQVFVNLLDNAVKHTPPGGEILIRTDVSVSADRAIPRSAIEKSGSWVKVDVHNSGSSIPEADLPRIFERFYQVDRARARNGDGTGLGLAIVQEIVEAHDGRIEVQSDQQSGTTFTVYLPSA